MSLSRNAQRSLLRLVTVLVVALVGSGVAYDIASTPPTYLESGTVVFSLPRSMTSPNAYFIFANPLITSSEVMIQSLTSPQDQQQIRDAGGTASVTMALVNLYDEEYPDYGVPLATLTAASPSAAQAHRTFMIAAGRLGDLLAARQAAAGVTRRNRISAQVIAATGPVVQAGSAKRVLAGLALLALMAIAGLWGIIDARAASPAAQRRRGAIRIGWPPSPRSPQACEGGPANAERGAGLR
jgi:hypothetical protein